MSDARRACLARLHEMDAALLRMEGELPEDVRGFGAEVRHRVAAWRERLAVGEADLSQLADVLGEIGLMMDALTARLLLVRWDGPKRNGPKS